MPTTIVEKIKKTETSKDKKFELILDSLEVKGYRCFEHLTIEQLGRVNLIVGKNNVGKTALLEALWIYANKGYQSASYFSLFIVTTSHLMSIPSLFRSSAIFFTIISTAKMLMGLTRKSQYL